MRPTLRQHKSYLTLLVIGYASLSFSPHVLTQPAINDDTKNDTQQNTDPLSDRENPVSASPNKSKDRRTAEQIQQQKKRLLEEHYAPKQIKQLSAGNDPFIALWEKDQTGNPFGAILIVHDESQTSDWPHTISALRKELPQHGWATLTIALPKPTAKAIPLRPALKKNSRTDPKEMAEPDANDQNTPAQDPDISKAKTIDSKKDTVDTQNNSRNDNQTPPNAQTRDKPGDKISPKMTEDRAIARLKAAITYLNDAGQFNIAVVTHGVNALRLMRYMNENTSDPQVAANKNMKKNTKVKMQYPVRVAIFVNARNVVSGYKTQIGELLTLTNFPILDIYFNTHYLDGQEAKERKVAATANAAKPYIQIKLLPPSHVLFDDENRFTRRIKGFLNTQAKGVEIESN